ncbi:bifunctional adenosylcobinamide kinase/adenosylcobinamide-phosphate guanylyltransferase [Butyrivibrio sp. XPD2006]|uniref:bifunctional adenosylcobinamide kinase/adenosylcobinamide-phosphate guanylyltransferase n=1 Tax=Butyrivibrio sp. XPD2006 TaxID=1280668 RepID=UPI0003B62401|nr:bifunctional adenosylcobinamide kinase/adenosylcobinamide-phosphate guanylyltransferase [Butyrivibrio sp. XPD2006]
MVTLVVGVPDSGKSALAEELAIKLSGDTKRIYLATMEILDEAGEERVKKHRKKREGKGFFTIEEPVKVWDAVAKVQELEKATVLVECISNLVGNVMHDDGSTLESALEDISKICKEAKNTVLVTNSFACEEGFDEETKEYVSSLDEVNGKLRSLADTVYEFVEGEWQKSENN